ncbi:MAG TPA: tRNA (adenosine(37)-N6)-threonylcarbamoyltransferase complex dimerization subunit type 1 TsaB [Terriglobales bacterium]|nr:tRNA (adenosine(37)-N6)-threonylcarbamoyltransferase complex dimerization subunit type 1 TsaB [Terriglobales bacterium]
MLLLGIDTSGKHGSLALARGDARRFEVLEVMPLTGGTFSAQLIPQIASLLSKHDLKKEDVDAIAAASGPGSFTGLRVGLAAVKALAEVLGKPVAMVSLLEAVAVESGQEGKVVAALDAGRSEVYAGEFEVKGGQAVLCHECLFTPGEFADVLRTSGRHAVTPDEAVARTLKELGVAEAVVTVSRPRSDAIARLGLRKILTGRTVTPEELDANYIRRSDAEIFQK